LFQNDTERGGAGVLPTTNQAFYSIVSGGQLAGLIAQNKHQKKVISETVEARNRDPTTRRGGPGMRGGVESVLMRTANDNMAKTRHTTVGQK